MITTQVTDTFGINPITYPERTHETSDAAKGYARELIQRRKNVQVLILQNGLPIDQMQSDDSQYLAPTSQE